MNPLPYLHAFAILTISALALYVVRDFWLPIVLTAGGMLALVYILRK